jgi:hypothetical protein
MPKPGTKEWEEAVDYMRADLQSGMQYTKMENIARKILKNQGKNFDKEFRKWKENRNVK